MSLWQFSACVEGWKEANGVETKPEAMSDEEYLELEARLG